ncbi:hypothetical protein ILUMI_18693 [Ignelater luminosus]|uniref:Reverse transcriptase/retrotransposon-derived protein RNase H-like domain-containing protein n=1 Tax=Ignelater luminosus TaxID=2038154 RepID=A0A8K0CHR2_IGNLU|nr:hypothetical protein ILUMI_18693 [Ignelater luminosus]
MSTTKSSSVTSTQKSGASMTAYSAQAYKFCITGHATQAVESITLELGVTLRNVNCKKEFYEKQKKGDGIENANLKIRKSVQGFGRLKNVKFHLDKDEIRSVQELKLAITCDSVLCYRNFNKPFISAADASDVSMGTILRQIHNGFERPRKDP